MKEKYINSITVVGAIAIGVLIGWIDSRPNWDDTGITVALIFGASAFFGFINPKHPWIWALLIGICIPMWNISLSNNYESFIAVVVAFIGAYVGAYGQKKSMSRA
jgi:hypothetical protein